MEQETCSFPNMLDPRGQLLRAAVGFATLAALPVNWGLT
jgi:hypothetical protein